MSIIDLSPTKGKPAPGKLPPAKTPRERFADLIEQHTVLAKSGVNGTDAEDALVSMPGMPSPRSIAVFAAALCRPEILAVVVDAMAPALAGMVRRYASEAFADAEAEVGDRD